MNKFELFSMIFYTLNHYWKDHRSDELGQFLSDMNPFLFDDIGSAIPEIYSQFCHIINTNLTIDNSFGCAIEYINSVDLPCVKEAFSWVEEPEWKERLKSYLETDHKGKEICTK